MNCSEKEAFARLEYDHLTNVVIIPGLGRVSRDILEMRGVWWDAELGRWRLAPGSRFKDRSADPPICVRALFPTDDVSAEII